jgi:hypothetical protein
MSEVAIFMKPAGFAKTAIAVFDVCFAIFHFKQS